MSSIVRPRPAPGAEPTDAYELDEAERLIGYASVMVRAFGADAAT